MHELGLIQETLDILTENVHLIREGAVIKRVILEIGEISGVFPDAIRFSFELCSEGTVAEGAELEIKTTPGLAKCRECKTEVRLNLPYGCCTCGSIDLEWLTGHEFKLLGMETA